MIDHNESHDEAAAAAQIDYDQQQYAALAAHAADQEQMEMGEDNQLLMLAAKAAGFALNYRRSSNAFWYNDPETGIEHWRPLDYDGQAFRLAVQLRLSIDRLAMEVIVSCAMRQDECVIEPDDDPAAATRRAIVRYAAQIGESMP